MLTASKHRQITDRLTEELAQIGTRFNSELASDLACVNQLVAHVERYRGKMLRPILVVVTGMATSPTTQEITEGHRVVATVVEMVHMATLVHDDILDDAEIRRRGATVNHLRGNETAVMLGDYLISHAYHLCSSLPSPAVSRMIADTTNTVCEGELLQLANRDNWLLDEATYFEIIRRKTASLCGMCCKLGGMLNDADGPTCENLYQYGEQLGIAFQIVDDVLDLTGDERTVGKTLGRDLAKGKLTLPLIRWARSQGEGDEAQDLLRRAAKLDSPDAADAVAELRRRVAAGGSVDDAQRTAARMVAHAKALIDDLPASPSRELLLSMADAVITRKF